MKKINNGLYGIAGLLCIFSSQVMAYTCPTAEEIIVANNIALAEGQTTFIMHKPYGSFEPFPTSSIKMEKNDIVFYEAGVLHDKDSTTSLAEVGCSYYANTNDPDPPTLNLIQKAASANARINYNGNNQSKWWKGDPEDANIHCSEYHAENCVFEPASK